MPIQTDCEPLPTSRRDFLRWSLFSPLALTTLGGVGLSGCASQPQPYYDNLQQKHYFFLTDDDVTFLRSLVPAILAGSLPPDPDAADLETSTVIDYMDRGIDAFGSANQGEIRKLFDLLEFGPTRALAAGVWSSWKSAEPSDVEEFLDDWRHSSVALFNNAYSALVKMTALVDYGLPTNWSRSGYPGPPADARETLPQFQEETSA